MPLARAAVAGGAGACAASSAAAAPSRPQALPLTPELLTGTLEASLRRLGTDHLDLYALHDVAAAALTDEVAPRARGHPRRRQGPGGGGGERRAPPGSPRSPSAPPSAWCRRRLPAPGAPDALLPAARAAGFGVVLHSVFGVDGSLAALKARAAADPAFRAAVTGGAGDLDRALARRLLARAFALNPGRRRPRLDVLARRAGPRTSPSPRRRSPRGRASLLDRSVAAQAGGGGIAPAPVGARPPDVAPHGRGLGEARAGRSAARARRR